MGQGNEVAIKNGDPDEEPRQEEEEEEELQDPIDPIREKCEAKPEAQKYFEKLEECNSRVESKSKTEESCAEELYQYIHHVDHCNQNGLLVTLQNDNHSPGSGPGRLVPSSHQRTILGTFSRGDKRSRSAFQSLMVAHSLFGKLK